MLSHDLGKQAHFREWLVRWKNYSQKTAGDANSRAKRAERVLGESLESMIAAGLDVPAILTRLADRISEKEPIQDRAERLARELQRSVRLYLEFRRAR